MNINFRILIWVFAFALLFLIFEQTKLRSNLNAKPIIHYKNPYTYQDQKGNNTQLRLAMRQLILGEQIDADLPANALNTAKNILGQAPLSSQAVQNFADINSLKAKNINEDSLRLVDKALNRNGRNREALTMKIYGKFLQQDIEGALENIDNLLRIHPNSEEIVLPVLTSIYNYPPYKSLLLEKLSEAPRWSSSFVSANLASLKEEDVEAWVAILPRFLQNNENPTIARITPSYFIGRLFTYGMYDEAHDLMLKLHPEIVESENQLIFNPEFKPNRNIPRYDWLLHNTSDVIAEYENNNGIFISFNAPDQKIVMQQFSIEKTRAPMEIAFDYDFFANDKKGHFEWRFTCAKSGQIFMTHPLNEDTAVQQGKFIPVPARPEDCQAINIELWGIPSLYTRRFSIILKKIQIRSLAQ